MIVLLEKLSNVFMNSWMFYVVSLQLYFLAVY